MLLLNAEAERRERKKKKNDEEGLPWATAQMIDL